MEFRYLNTDLDLKSVRDLTALGKFFEARKVSPLRAPYQEGKFWYAILETNRQYRDLESNIRAMLKVIEQLRGPLKRRWLTCSLREFNVGYDCGHEPWAYNQGLSNGTLKRLAKARVTFRITLYPAPIEREGAGKRVSRKRRKK